MNILDELRRLFSFDAWANAETLASLAAVRPAPPEHARLVMAHIVAAERLWLRRLGVDRTPPGPVWPDFTLERSQEEAEALAEILRPYLSGLEVAQLTGTVSYTNTKGEPWSNKRGDILMHVILHSVHHRAQIANDLRAAGFEPAVTDFIHGVRQGVIESFPE